LDVAYGPWFWAHTVYSYLLLSLASIQLLAVVLRSPDLYRRQSGVLLLGLLLPWVSNGLYLSGLVPVPNLDLTPFAFAFSGIAFVVGLFRLRLLDIAPVARRAVVDGISDGMMVLDAQGRFVDLNPAAERLIGRSAAEVIGKAADQVLAAYAELVDQYRDLMGASAEITLWSDVSGTQFGPRPGDIRDVAHHYELRISPLTDRAGQLVARLVVLHEITAQKQVERALLMAREELEARVEERTAELAKLNRELLSEIDERVRAEKERERLIGQLQEALDEVKVLRGILPICMSCNKIRDDEGYWQDVAFYIEERSEAEFTHGICPDCAQKLYPDFYSD
jgi:PAS domain S-box-containing protein